MAAMRDFCSSIISINTLGLPLFDTGKRFLAFKYNMERFMPSAAVGHRIGFDSWGSL